MSDSSCMVSHHCTARLNRRLHQLSFVLEMQISTQAHRTNQRYNDLRLKDDCVRIGSAIVASFHTIIGPKLHSFLIEWPTLMTPDSCRLPGTFPIRGDRQVSTSPSALASAKADHIMRHPDAEASVQKLNSWNEKRNKKQRCLSCET